MGLGEAIFGKAGEKQPAPEKYIANIAGNRLLYQKAYLIEFIGDDGVTPEDVFTFSVPPENEELTYTERKTETKTFGGLHVDEYGIDAAKIILSGSTVNQSLKKIYRSPKDNLWLTGEEEIYYLRDLLIKHRSLDKLIGEKNKNRKIMIYDLSKLVARKNKNNNNIKNYWQALPGDLKIRRANDKPFVYKYTFEFTGQPIEKMGVYNSHGEPPELSVGKLGLLQEIMKKIIAVLNRIDKINGYVNNVLDKINQVSNLLKVLGNVMSYAANTLTGIIDSAGNTVVGFIEGATSVINGANAIISLPRTIQLKTLNVGLEIRNATKELVKATDELADTCRGMFAEGGEYWAIPQEVLDQYGMTNAEFKDSVLVMLNDAENAANELAAAAKSNAVPDVTIGNPDPKTGEQRIVLSYGHTNITVKDTDNMESLAAQYLGDPGKAIDIATYNGVASIGDLEPGDVIKIPITRKTPRITNNLIYSAHGERDNYGKDIMLTDDGRIVVSPSGDYALTQDVDNLSQAVLLRLRERVAKRIRLVAYGIRTNISDPTAGISYIISSVDLTVLSDPRVLSVDNISFKGIGDTLWVYVHYSDINKADGKIEGRV